MEGSGANTESGVRVRSKLHPLQNFELHKKRPTFFVDLIDRLDANCNDLQAKAVPRESKAKNLCPLGCHGLTFVLKTEAQPLVRQIIRLDYFAVHGGASS